MRPYEFYRGETVNLFLEAVGASAEQFAIVQGVTAKMKPALDGEGVPADTVPAVADLIGAPVPPGTTALAGWRLTLSASSSAALAAGVYVVQATLALQGGDSDKSEPILIRLKDSL